MCEESESCWRTMMAKKRHLKMTAEERAEREKTQRMAWERIAYHESKAREQAGTLTSRQS
jgi:hypothetical protein